MAQLSKLFQDDELNGSNSTNEPNFLTKPKLKVLEGGGEGDGVPRGSLKSVKSSGDQEEKITEANQLSTAESTASSQSSGFYNPLNEKTKSRINNLRARFFKKKWVAAGGGAAAMISILLLLIIYLGTLLVPGLAANMLTYRFSKVERLLNQNTDEVIAEKAAVDSAETAAEQTALASKFAVLKPLDDFYAKLKNLSPNAVYDNLKENGLITFNYEQGSNGLGVLKSITVSGQELPIDPSTRTFTGRVFHPLANFKGSVQLADNMSSALKEALPDNGIGVIIRGKVEQLIMNDINAPRFAWVTSKFKNKTPAEAQKEQQIETEQAVNPDPAADASGSIVSAEQDAINQGVNEEVASLSDPPTTSGLPKTIPPLIEGLTSGLSNNGFNSVVKALNPAYAILLPVCIVYDSSIQGPNASQTIANNSAEDQRSFFYLAAAADQEKNGNTTAEAVGALNQKLNGDNNIGSSIPMELANGQQVDTGSVSISPQTAGNGQFTAINAFLPSLAPYINPIASTICPIATNLKIAVAGAVISIGAFFFGDEGALAATKASTTESEGMVQAIVGKFGSLLNRMGITENASARGVGLVSKLQDVLPSKAELATISGVSIVVRIATAMKMATLNDGYSLGNDFANQADAGATLNSNEDIQKQFYGTPLSSTQVAYNNQQDKQFIAGGYKNESLYDRYISPSNPQSLLAKTGFALYADLNKSFFPKIISSVARILNPSTLISSLYNLTSWHSKAQADTVAKNDSTDYGVVQWGYTDEEENLINATSNNTYQPLENDAVLSQYPDQLKAIEQTYGPCFNADVSILLTSKPSQGPDDGDFYITRDSNGNVIGGMCTDQYLGPNNTADQNAYDPGNGKYDLVFRWRLQQAYDNTLDTLSGIANASQ